jgi:ABC-2 type transport system permease protein
MPFSLRTAVEDMDLEEAGLSVGSVILPSAVGFSLLFAVYSALVSVYAARREELVLKRLRTGELRDVEILAGAALPSVLIGLVQCVVLTIACAALLDVGAPEAPHLAVLGLLLGLVMWPAIAAVVASFSKSLEGAQVAAMPLLLVSMMGSGTFIPFELMPDRLAAVCELLPLSPVITLIRGGWTGDLGAYEALGAIATAVAWLVLSVFAVQRWFRWEPRH